MSFASQPNSPDEVQARIESLRAELISQLRSLRRSNWIASLIGILFIVLIGVYFYYGYRLTDYLKPELLVDATEDTLRTELPKARKELAKNILKASPEVAEMVSNSLIENMPDGRKHLESVIEKRMDDVLARMDILTEEQLHKFVTKNKKQIQESIKTLKTDRDSKLVLNDMAKLVENDLGMDIQKDAENLVSTMHELNERMDRIRVHEGKGLNPADLTMRRVLMICKRLMADRLETPK